MCEITKVTKSWKVLGLNFSVVLTWSVTGAFLYSNSIFSCFIEVHRGGTFMFLLTLWCCCCCHQCFLLEHLKDNYVGIWNVPTEFWRVTTRSYELGATIIFSFFSCFCRATLLVFAFPAGFIMITPAFELTQDPDFLTIKIRVPYARASEFDIYFEGEDFKFYAKPYFLRQVVEKVFKNWSL